MVGLVNGCTYVFPAQLAQDLSGASPDPLATIIVDGQGFNPHWPGFLAPVTGWPAWPGR